MRSRILPQLHTQSSLLCPGLLATRGRILQSHQILFLIFLFSLFHALQVSFSHSQFWSWGMLTDQTNCVSLLPRCFVSPRAGITLLSKPNNPALIRSQPREQPPEARGSALLSRGGGCRFSLEGCDGDPIAGVTYKTPGSPAKREAIYSSRFLLVG